MIDAPTAKLGDVCTFIGGGTPSRERPDFFEGTIPWATVKDFKKFVLDDTQEHISEAAIAASASNVVDVGTVLLVTRVGLGKVAIAGVPLAINQDIKALTPKSNLLPEFLFWFLVYKADSIKEMGVGATVKGVTLHDVRAIEIPIPSLDQQRSIIDILSRAEGIVRLRREAQQKAAELVPAIFLEMFGDPGTNPKGWKAQPLPEVLTRPFKNGLYLPKENYSQEGSIEGVEMVHMSDAFYGQVKRGNLRRVLADVKQISDYELTAKDLLVARRSLTIQGAAKLCGIPDVHESLMFESSFIRLTPDSTKVRVAFLLAYLNHESTRQAHIKSRISGITITGINQAALSQVPVLLPPLSMQKMFEQRVESVQSICAQQLKAVSNANATFNALLSQSFGVGYGN